MIIKFSDIEFPTLTKVVNNINETLDCSKFIENTLIEIDTWSNLNQVMVNSKNVAENGFAFCISNYNDNGVFKRIIIINTENCELLNLTDREITAIIYHELGHLLNSPKLVIVPTVTHCLRNVIKYEKKTEDEIKENNLIQIEFFADSYANKYGYNLELISTFNKYNDHFENKIGYFDLRVEKININELFEGDVKPINTNGW
jgi:hypothetical protein